MTDYLDEISQFAAEFRAADLCADVVERTQLVLADSVAAIVGGAAEPEIGALAKRLCKTSAGSSSVLGTGLKADAALSALLNGSAGTFLEMDEGNQFCKGHPGMHTVPAVLAIAEGREPTGAELIAAIAIGYEVGARVGIATHLRPSMHPHGTWGGICAAVGAARLYGFDAGRMRTLLNIGSNMCLATSRPTMLEGGTVRNVYAGISGQLGVLSCNLVEAGFSGERDGISNVFGNVVSDKFDPAAMTEQLGKRWEVARNYFKLHSCCRYNHAALDALDMICQRNLPALEASSIRQVQVTTYGLAAELADQAPGNTLAAKFSLPFAISTTLINGSSGVGSFTWDAVRSQAVQDLAKRVYVSEDPEMSEKLPNLRPAAVAIHMNDGSVHRATTDTNRGDWRDPYSKFELREKYDSLTARQWQEPHSGVVYGEIQALSQAATTRLLFDAIGQAEKPVGD